jgi:hypothetical protein
MTSSSPQQVILSSAAPRRVVVGSTVIYSGQPLVFGYDLVRQRLERSGWAAWMLDEDIRRGSAAVVDHTPRSRKAATPK